MGRHRGGLPRAPRTLFLRGVRQTRDLERVRALNEIALRRGQTRPAGDRLGVARPAGHLRSRSSPAASSSSNRTSRRSTGSTSIQMCSRRWTATPRMAASISGPVRLGRGTRQADRPSIPRQNADGELHGSPPTPLSPGVGCLPGEPRRWSKPGGDDSDACRCRPARHSARIVCVGIAHTKPGLVREEVRTRRGRPGS